MPPPHVGLGRAPPPGKAELPHRPLSPSWPWWSRRTTPPTPHPLGDWKGGVSSLQRFLVPSLPQWNWTPFRPQPKKPGREPLRSSESELRVFFLHDRFCNRPRHEYLSIHSPILGSWAVAYRAASQDPAGPLPGKVPRPPQPLPLRWA